MLKATTCMKTAWTKKSTSRAKRQAYMTETVEWNIYVYFTVYIYMYILYAFWIKKQTGKTNKSHTILLCAHNTNQTAEIVVNFSIQFIIVCESSLLCEYIYILVFLIWEFHFFFRSVFKDKTTAPHQKVFAFKTSTNKKNWSEFMQINLRTTKQAQRKREKII